MLNTNCRMTKLMKLIMTFKDLRNFLDGSFENSSVTDLYIYYNFTDESEKLAPASSFSGITIHVTEGAPYLTHYDWNDTSGGYKMVIIK